MNFPIKQPHLRQAIDVCLSGGVIAYPTESVYGLGCLPFYEHAVKRILGLKQRSVKKGLICVAADIGQLEQLVEFNRVNDLDEVMSCWPGPVTWLIPARSSTPAWLTGEHQTLAVRVSAHPLVQRLCRQTGPLVSTSANRQGILPAYTSRRVRAYFADRLDYIYPGELPRQNKPSQIRDAMSGKVLRNS